MWPQSMPGIRTYRVLLGREVLKGGAAAGRLCILTPFAALGYSKGPDDCRMLCGMPLQMEPQLSEQGIFSALPCNDLKTKCCLILDAVSEQSCCQRADRSCHQLVSQQRS